MYVRAERISIINIGNESSALRYVSQKTKGELKAELAAEELRNTRKRRFKHFVGCAAVPGAVEATGLRELIKRETTV